jgi:hypothetical protein
MAYNKPAVDLDNRIVHQSRIKLVGVELEGAWKKCPSDCTVVDSIHPAPNQLGRDGSLKKLKERLTPTVLAAINAGQPSPYVAINGELPSPPLSEAEICDWMRTHWPDEIDSDCGMHIHISVKSPLVYMWLMDDEAFPATCVEYIKRWAKREEIDPNDEIWNRLADKNEYCQHRHWPKEQVNSDKDHDRVRYGNRYTAIVFRYKLGTIECRLLSMPKDVEQGIRAVKEFCSIVNRYLVATAKRERKVNADVIVRQPAYEMNIDLTV